MSRYLSLFDAAGRVASLRDAEFIAMLQLMGRVGAVRRHRGPAYTGGGLTQWGGLTGGPAHTAARTRQPAVPNTRKRTP
jgi:hypothetical protein